MSSHGPSEYTTGKISFSPIVAQCIASTLDLQSQCLSLTCNRMQFSYSSGLCYFNPFQLYNNYFDIFIETQAYVLNFHGRVTQASVKNFQLVHSADGENMEEKIVGWPMLTLMSTSLCSVCRELYCGAVWACVRRCVYT